MDIKLSIMYRMIIVGFFVMINILSCQRLSINNNNKENNVPEFILTQRSLFKKLAFCSCIYHEFPNDSIIVNKEASASEYFQMMSYNPELPIHKDITKFTYRWLVESKYVSTMEVEGYNIGIMKCIEYYQSKELDSLSKMYDKYIQKKN